MIFSIITLLTTVLTTVAAVLAIVGIPFGIAFAICSYVADDPKIKQKLKDGALLAIGGPLALILAFFFMWLVFRVIF